VRLGGWGLEAGSWRLEAGDKCEQNDARASRTRRCEAEPDQSDVVPSSRSNSNWRLVLG
jgi:hypothetical protein